MAFVGESMSREQRSEGCGHSISGPGAIMALESTKGIQRPSFRNASVSSSAQTPGVAGGSGPRRRKKNDGHSLTAHALPAMSAASFLLTPHAPQRTTLSRIPKSTRPIGSGTTLGLTTTHDYLKMAIFRCARRNVSSTRYNEIRRLQLTGCARPAVMLLGQNP
jgi:hypothetical protein